MTHKILQIMTAMFFALAITSAIAGDGGAVEHENIVIALSIDDFELAETDISDLEVGDAQTFNTEGGKRIDLLRTEDGVEIYVDGELIETGLHGDHELHHEHMAWITEKEDIDVEALHHDGSHEKIIIINKEVNSD